MAPKTVPVVEFDGITYVLSERELPTVTRPGPVMFISRREVEATIGVMERRIAQNFGPAEKRKYYRGKLRAYRQLIGQPEGGADDGGTEAGG